jgi:hypothetical protein
MERKKRRGRPFGPVDGPIGARAAQGLHGRQFGRLHHLAQAAVQQQHHDGAVLFGQVESLHGQVDGLLHAGRGQGDDLVVAVPAAVHDLVVIALGGAMLPRPGPPRITSTSTAGTSVPAM